MRERRSTIRIPLRAEGTYELDKGLGGPRLALTQDISLGGMRLVAAERLQPGDRVQISVSLPIQGAVTLQGMVVWVREADETGQMSYECGLRWTGINPASQARINAFITGHTSTALTPEDFLNSLLSPVVRWSRVVLVSLAVSALLMVGLLYWVQWYSLANEAKELRRQVAAYQAMLGQMETKRR